MARYRIVLLGSNGQLGQRLHQELAQLHDVTALTREDVDLSNAESIQPALDQHTCDILINAAAYTAVDRAEEDSAAAHTVNATAVGEMARWAQANGSLLLHFSTDYVFDGSMTRPATEDDPTAPQSAYGMTKLAGEKLALAHAEQVYILRTSWVYSLQGNNFLNTMLRLMGERSELRVVNDQIGTPTWTGTIVGVVQMLISRLESQPAAYGVYHLSSNQPVSWWDFACEIRRQAAVLMPLKVTEIEPIASDEYPQTAQRPAYSVLDSHKLCQQLDLQLPDWRDALASCLAER